MGAYAISVTALDDPVSTKLRTVTEERLSRLIENMSSKAVKGTLTSLDKALLHSCILLAIGITRFKYPEGAIVLYHYVYGDGSPLELSPDYFQRSAYLQKKIFELGEGNHGPIRISQQDDWRFSLALNPYFLSVDGAHIKVYHPHIDFSILDCSKKWTIVPIGKLRIRICDNLVSALNPTPFYVFSEWDRK